MRAADQIRLVLTEGTHAGSHKFALLRAILDYIVEKNPAENEEVNIPLIYIAEKFLTYYWVMYINNVKQLRADGRFLYYDYLETLVDELKIPGISKGHLADKHIHTMLGGLKEAEKFSPKLITALNRTRINVFNHPVRHTLYVSTGEEPTRLDFYNFEEASPGRVEAKDYREFYQKEITFVSVKSTAVAEFKEMYYWFEKAIITAWAEFTDQFPENRAKSNHTGLTLLAIPEPERESLKNFKKHFLSLGVEKCPYCNVRPFDSIDHVIPWKMVKSDQFWNMLPICKPCNSRKSDRILTLNDRAKSILKRSISDIVKRSDDLPEWKEQIVAYFAHTRQNAPLQDHQLLGETLYEATLKRVHDFSGGA